MAIYFYNGVKDERKTYNEEVRGGIVYAYQVNSDYTLEEVLLDNQDYNNGCIGRCTLDCDDETEEKVRCAMARKNGWMHWTLVKEGDIFKVVKGKKYPHGMEFTVKRVYEWKADIPYVIGIDGTKVAYYNCEFVKGVSEYDYQPEVKEFTNDKDYVVPTWFIKKTDAIPEDKKEQDNSWVVRTIYDETEKAVKCMVDAGADAYIIWVPKSILMEC